VRLQCSRLQIIVSDASARQATRNSAAERQNLCIIVMLHKPGECLIFRQNDGPYKVEPGRGRVIAWNPTAEIGKVWRLVPRVERTTVESQAP
jgi:hypothetical protein